MLKKRRIIKFVLDSEKKSNIETNIKNTPINGKQFLIAMRDAGKRFVDGKPVFQESLKRNDQIEAIQNFIGYDLKKDFGAQESYARMLAMQEIKPVKSEPFKRTLVASNVKGFVKGANDPSKKKKDHLNALLLSSLESQAKYLGVIQSSQSSTNEKLLNQGLYEVECERYKVIKSQLDELSYV